MVAAWITGGLGIITIIYLFGELAIRTDTSLLGRLFSYSDEQTPNKPTKRATIQIKTEDLQIKTKNNLTYIEIPFIVKNGIQFTFDSAATDCLGKTLTVNGPKEITINGRGYGIDSIFPTTLENGHITIITLNLKTKSGQKYSARATAVLGETAQSQNKFLLDAKDIRPLNLPYSPTHTF